MSTFIYIYKISSCAFFFIFNIQFNLIRRKATRQVVDSWLVSHATAGGAGNHCTCPPQLTNGTNAVGSISTLSSPSGSGGAIGGATGCGAGASNTEAANMNINNSSPTHGCGQNCTSRSGSGATTPVRLVMYLDFN